jgi:putative Ca2+/H+ antiporter (TMEM165/GDT1 family)
VALGVVRVPGAAVVAGRLVLGELDPVALDVVGGALFVAGHAQLLSAGTVPC